eukprot:11054971-Alexandrium_andersonii.AAC.1
MCIRDSSLVAAASPGLHPHGAGLRVDHALQRDGVRPFAGLRARGAVSQPRLVSRLRPAAPVCLCSSLPGRTPYAGAPQ